MVNVNKLKQELNVFDRGSMSFWCLYVGSLIAIIPKGDNGFARNVNMLADFAIAMAAFGGIGGDYGLFAHKNGIPPHPAEIIRAMLDRQSEGRWEHMRGAIKHSLFLIPVMRRHAALYRTAQHAS